MAISLQDLLMGAGILSSGYGAKRQNDFSQRVQLRDMQNQVQRAWMQRNAMEASQAAMLQGMNQSNDVWSDYYSGYQDNLPQFSPEAKREGVQGAIDRATGSQTQALQEAHSSDMGSGIEGRVSADYTGGMDSAAGGSLARAMARAGRRGTMGGFEDDVRRESGLVSDMGFDANAAKQASSDALTLGSMRAQEAGYVPPEQYEYISGGGNPYGTLGQLLGVAGNWLGSRPTSVAEPVTTDGYTGTLDSTTPGLGLRTESPGVDFSSQGPYGQGFNSGPGRGFRAPLSWADMYTTLGQ